MFFKILRISDYRLWRNLFKNVIMWVQVQCRLLRHAINTYFYKSSYMGHWTRYTTFLKVTASAYTSPATVYYTLLELLVTEVTPGHNNF